MNPQTTKQESVFELVRSMTKAEKRNFKLYATRLAGNQEAKFVALFDCLDALEEYDEERILQRCPIKKEQLPNMKAHLYKQILVSIRLLDVQHIPSMQLREQLDFARILYDKGLYRQCVKMVDKVKEQAMASEQYMIVLDALELQKKLETTKILPDLLAKSEMMNRQAIAISSRIANTIELSNTVMQLYGLYLQLGYARTQKDLNLIDHVFSARLRKYDREQGLSFIERFYLYQANVWYYYIRHDMLQCYRYVCRWIDLFDRNPQMKQLMFESYLRGYSRLLDGLFLLRSYKRFIRRLEELEEALENIDNMSDNIRMVGLHILYANRINKHFYEGSFAEGVKLVPEVDRFLSEHTARLNVHHQMVLNYKVACLYFGNGDYHKCIGYLERIISTRDPQIRRDLQCYARILNLICSYEAGIDYNLDYQVRSVYSFLVKMNDMQEVQKEMMRFLKRLNSMYESNFKDELRTLYDKLKQYETHPYERRTFYYLDILSWLESKLQGIPVAEVIRRRFVAENGKKQGMLKKNR